MVEKDSIPCIRKKEKMAWGVFESTERSVRLHDNVYLVSCLSKLHNTQNPATEGDFS